MTIEKCPVCLGKKTVLGLGCMIKDCDNCNAVGYIGNDDKPEIKPEPKEEAKEISNNGQLEVKISKPKGRPKKIIN